MNAFRQAASIADLRDIARRKLPRGIFEFVDRGAEDEIALGNNRRRFEQIKLKQRPLIDVSRRTTGVTLLGKPSSSPIVVAPTGAAGLCWYKGELELAKAAATEGIPFTVAIGSLTPLEQIAAEAGGRLWFQLSVWKERKFSYELVERARRANFEALVVTVDQVVAPNLEFNRRNGFATPFRLSPRAALDCSLHPGWTISVLIRYLMTTGMPRYENYPTHLRRPVQSDPSAGETMRKDNLTWDDIRIFREIWPGTLVVKGINYVDDAIRAVELGADAIVVSNHGGRNMDSAASSIDLLPQIADAVASRTTVLLDSGIRRGSDIAKALSLGADGVLAGRAMLYGVASGGSLGVRKAIQLLGRELNETMAFCGCNNPNEFSRSMLLNQPTDIRTG